MNHDEDEPFPLPGRLPTGVGSTEPHAQAPTGPPEPESAELKAIMAVHEELKGLTRLMRDYADERLEAQAMERRQNEALKLIERRLAIAGIPDAPELPNGHADG